MIRLLAQSAHHAPSDSAPLFKMVFLLMVVLLMAAVLVAILSVVRRRMNAQMPVARDFTLNTLRTLHREGKLTDDEFERAKSKLVTSIQSELTKKKPTSLTERQLGEELKGVEARGQSGISNLKSRS